MKHYAFARIGRHFGIGVRLGGGQGLALLFGILAGAAVAMRGHEPDREAAMRARSRRKTGPDGEAYDGSL
jgi:hypothetical protein